MLVSGNDFYCGNSSGAPCQFALKSQIPSQYVHPSAKQCNYAYTHPTTKQCNYSVDLSGYAKSSELNSLKTSVSEGKSLVAAAVTGKGVSTAADATFQTMSDNIKKLSVFTRVKRVSDTLNCTYSGYRLNGNTITLSCKTLGSTITVVLE